MRCTQIDLDFSYLQIHVFQSFLNKLNGVLQFVFLYFKFFFSYKNIYDFNKTTYTEP
jgi:hypothetical protein